MPDGTKLFTCHGKTAMSGAREKLFRSAVAETALVMNGESSDRLREYEQNVSTYRRQRAAGFPDMRGTMDEPVWVVGDGERFVKRTAEGFELGHALEIDDNVLLETDLIVDASDKRYETRLNSALSKITGHVCLYDIRDVIEWFRTHGGSFKRIVFFTIGGSNAIDFMEELAPKVKSFSPNFEGFTCFFYEGIFNVYQDHGILGFQVPDIDFYWGDGIVCPEFREYVVAHGYSLYEKCVIYDGGARRYEIPDHYKEVVAYWNEVLEVSDKVDIMDLTHERLGYVAPISYEDWLKVTHFSELGDQSVLYSDERVFLAKAKSLTLREVATKRLDQIKQTLKGYE